MHEINGLVKQKPELVKKLTALCEQCKVENKIVDYAKIIKIELRDPY